MVVAPARADVVSSFTIIKGALVDETYAVFQGWDFGRSKKENLDEVRESNRIAAPSRNWLRDVCKVLNRRFDPAERDKPLVMLAQAGIDRDAWRPLLLWHMTRDEFLLRDFLIHWLFVEFEAGVFRMRVDDVIPYLEDIERRGLTSSDDGWSEATRKRVAAGLLGIAGDIGLLRGTLTKEFAGLHLHDDSLLYLLHAARDQEQAPARAFELSDWKMFLLSRGDLERELLRLHQFQRLEFHRAGSLIELSLPFESLAAYAESLVS